MQLVIGGVEQLIADEVFALLRAPERHFEILRGIGTRMIVYQITCPSRVIGWHSHSFVKRQ
ncbi:Uncharacterised protein [Vibrio cholerae]|nr:Uncharacterised protein [Vibrio cholerae]CSC99852.1 Uncharacterised protein [Vibrio cholerae]CSD04390.1 Uncharacterised protein [Vibrio cholerae]CSD17712.1 Uncharacterised protein [Vibrio cholerae]CSD43741.1 Uncharacterised protein [Vibrio cholerae]